MSDQDALLRESLLIVAILHAQKDTLAQAKACSVSPWLHKLVMTPFHSVP